MPTSRSMPRDFAVRDDQHHPIQFGPIGTATARTKAGWLGQVVVAGEIVWESNLFDGEDDGQQAALADANGQVIDALKGLFA